VTIFGVRLYFASRPTPIVQFTRLGIRNGEVHLSSIALAINRLRVWGCNWNAHCEKDGMNLILIIVVLVLLFGGGGYYYGGYGYGGGGIVTVLVLLLVLRLLGII